MSYRKSAVAIFSFIFFIFPFFAFADITLWTNSIAITPQTGAYLVGFFFVANNDATVTQLCRWKDVGDVNNHELMLLDSSYNTTTPLAEVTVSPIIGTDNEYQCGNIDPTSVYSGQSYYVMSAEDDTDTYGQQIAVTADDAYLTNTYFAAYSNLDGTGLVEATEGDSFVPLNLTYETSTPTPTPTPTPEGTSTPLTFQGFMDNFSGAIIWLSAIGVFIAFWKGISNMLSGWKKMFKDKLP